MNNDFLTNAAVTYTRDKYALYLRKSRADLESELLGEGETLERHKKMLYKLADKHNISHDQITVYQEIVSGELIEERPAIQQLLQDLYLKKYKGVLVVEVERFARGNTKDQGEIAEAFIYSNTKILTPVKTYDPQNEYDQEYFEFGLFMSRREHKTINRRLYAGKISSIEEGNFIGSVAPYGYNAVRVHRKERILVANDDSKYLKMIFDMFTIDRLSTHQIAKKLTAMNVKTLKNKPEWNSSTIKDILKNEHYIGMLPWQQKVKKKVYIDGKLKRSCVRNKDYKLYKGKHKALISNEQFELAQKLINERYVPSIHAGKPLKNSFAGVLVCKDCERVMTLRTFTSDKHKDIIQHVLSDKCKKKSLPFVDVMQIFINALQLHVNDFEMQLNNNDAVNNRLRHEQTIKTMQDQLKKLNEKRNNLFDSFEEGIYTKSEFIERKEIITNKIDDLKNQINATADALPDEINYTEKIVKFKDVIKVLSDDNISAKIKNQYIKDIVEKITYDSIDHGFRKGGKIILEVFPKE